MSVRTGIQGFRTNYKGKEVTMIKAPYNFVPLEKTAFYPEWANRISQDIPFEDGVSGSIDYTMTAETPIFVRNGQTKDAKDNTFSHTTSHTIDGRYFIPGTSIKGEIRSVLEILSFGKMTQVQDARFGIRDLSGYDKKRYAQSIADEHCGWLYKDERGNYYIKDCGIPGRIATSLLNNSLRTFMSNPQLDWNFFKEKTRSKKEEKDINKTEREEITRSALLKYVNYGLSLDDLLNMAFLNSERLNFTFSGIENPNKSQYDKRKFFRIDNTSEKRGTIILTGQPNTTKKYDFIFFSQQGTSPIAVPDDIIQDFKSIHKNNYDFKNLWSLRLENGKEIPVFFTLNSERINAIGLTGMFRIPSATFIKGAIPVSLQSTSRMDMAECIFGTTNKVLGGLKGRVVFSHAFVTDVPRKQLPEVCTTLSSPKSSYAPLYTKQGTWNSFDVEIKGRKRYPVRNRVCGNETGNSNTQTKFNPLPEKTEFVGKIFFHNLRESELGALISALTFNGNPDCSHSIGEAKPLGYGKVKTYIVNINDEKVLDRNNHYIKDCQEKVQYYLNVFEDLMNRNFKGWPDCPSVNQLIAMAKGIPGNLESTLTYMQMSTNARDNEFVKNEKKSLDLFTDIIDSNGLSESNAESGDWKRKSQTNLECDVANEFGIECILNDIEEGLKNRDLGSVYERLSKFTGKDSTLRDDYKNILSDRLDKIRLMAGKLISEAKSAIDQQDFDSAILSYRRILDLNINEEYNLRAEHGIVLCSNVYPNVIRQMNGGNLIEAQRIVRKYNFNHTDKILNDCESKIEAALKLKEEEENKNLTKEKDRLLDVAKELYSRYKNSCGNRDENIQCLYRAVSICEDALGIELPGYNDAPIINLKNRCEEAINGTTKPIQTIDEAFKDVKLASIPAFAGRVRKWKRDSGINVLNEEHLSFLGNFIKQGLSSIKKDQKKSWMDHAKWNKEFKGVLEQTDIDAIFNVVNGD